ncbi:hypothetical protein, partial [Kitasatospora sp. NPDC127116]|uniref:hypothetical protein n=1 Tax=Kitasatospora sp. NPDC127116 TaxID=3345367 RepID=UPI003632306F
MLLTGSPPSPALHLVAATLGEAEVRRRLDAGADGLNTGWYVERGWRDLGMRRGRTGLGGGGYIERHQGL